jgi:hypothetical protein
LIFDQDKTGNKSSPARERIFSGGVTVMHAIKTSALTLAVFVVYMMLLLMPDSYRDGESTGERLPAGQELARIGQQQSAFRFEREQPAPPISDDTLPIAQDKPASRTASPPATQPVDWSQILHPELARIQALEHQPVDTALIELVPMLSSDDTVVRLAAIESLGAITNRATLPALSAALNDPDPQLRIAALEALASQEDESMITSIEPYLYDQDRDVRVSAIEALEDIESQAAVHALAGLLSDQDRLIRHQAVNALGEIGGENAMMYLLQARYDPDETIRANAEAILAEVNY